MIDKWDQGKFLWKYDNQILQHNKTRPFVLYGESILQLFLNGILLKTKNKEKIKTQIGFKICLTYLLNQIKIL